jgi:hypothetical protein
MTDSYRPTPSQLRLFAALATEICAREPEYLSAAGWFQTEFSFGAIDARSEAGLLPLDRQTRELDESHGLVRHERRDPSGFMERLLRATEYLMDIDDSALPKPDRLEHYRRVILVGALMTDPDFHGDVPTVAAALEMDRAHWPSAKALTVSAEGEVVLDRWWARDWVFDPRYSKWSFEPLMERALDVLSAEHARARSRDSAVEAADVVAPKADPRLKLSDTQRQILDALTSAANEGKGMTTKQLVTLTSRSPDAVFRAVKKLKALGHPISNDNNGTGYILNRG